MCLVSTRTRANAGGRGALAARMLALSLVLMVGCAQASAPRGLAQSPARFDPRAVALPLEELPAGYVLDAARTTFEERADGTLVHEAVYVREPGGPAATGPGLLKFGIGRLGSALLAAEQFVAVRQAYQQAGWSERGVPLLGDEATGFVSEAGALDSSYLFVFRFGRQLVASTVAGPNGSASLDHALGYAVRLSARLDAALAALPPDPPETVAVVPAAPPIQPSELPATESKRGAAATGESRPSARAVTVPTLVSDANVEEAPELGEGLRLGGFSGLFALDKDGTTFLSLTDRGPNGEVQIRGKKGMSFPLPSYSPRIVKLRLEGGKLRVAETVQLKLLDGFTDVITNTRDVSGLPAFDGVGEVPYDANSRDRLPFDPYGVDTEGITVDPRDGSYWLAEEYGPSIMHVSVDGTILLRLVPRGVDLGGPGQTVRGLLPGSLSKRKANRGFEGIAIAPDGSRVFAIMQSPLSNPDKKAGEASRHIRLVALDTSNADQPKLIGMYLYQAESFKDVGGKDQDDIKIGDLAALSATRMLASERDSDEGGSHKKVYVIDLAEATDITERESVSGKTVEQVSEADLRKAGIKLVGKALVVDLAKLGYRPDKLEGLAVVDANTLAVINDNDFGIDSIDDKSRVIKSNTPSRLVLIRVPEPLR